MLPEPPGQFPSDFLPRHSLTCKFFTCGSDVIRKSPHKDLFTAALHTQSPGTAGPENSAPAAVTSLALAHTRACQQADSRAPGAEKQFVL